MSGRQARTSMDISDSLDSVLLQLGTKTHLTARCEILPLGVDAFVIIDVVLPAVLGLVDIGESGIGA